MISAIFVERPKLAFVISIIMLLTGIISITQMPVAEYPEITPPQVMVTTMYVGASSQDVADTVAAPIESQINGLEDLLYYSSNSTENGSYELSIFFNYGTNDDIAQVNVQNAVKRAEPVLPAEVRTQGIQITKRSSDILSVFSFTADSGSMSVLELSNYVKTNVKDVIARVDGISNVMIFAAKDYSMRIWLDPQLMTAMGISTSEVSRAIQGQNLQAAAGSVGIETSNDQMQFKINVKGRLKTAEEFRNIIVRSDGTGNVVKLADIAHVELGSEQYAGGSNSDGSESIAMAIFRNTDANALATVKAATEELDRLSERFPQGVHYRVQFDPTEFIVISLWEIIQTLVEALILVVAVTYLFLQDSRATIIPTIAIPVSLIGTFPFLLALNFTVNTLTMFGLILVIGSLVDDAIIVVENVMTHLEKGESPREATLKGMKQITGPIIATTLVTVAIYVPICFYGGMVGEIYLQFAVTMCISICLSAVNALTLSPALCVMLLRKPKEKKRWFFLPFNKALDGFRWGFLKISGYLVRRALVTLILFGGVLYMNYYLYKVTPSSFLPAEDKGAVLVNVELPPGATQARTTYVMEQFSQKCKQIDGVSNILAITGFSMLSGEGENMGFGILKLSPWDDRTSPELQIGVVKQKIDAVLSQIPEAQIMTFVPPAIMGLGATGGVEFSLSAEGDVNPQDLVMNTNKFLAQLRGLTDVTKMAYTTYVANTPQILLKIDRAKAETLEVPISNIFSTLQSKLASYYVNDFNMMGYTFKVKIQSEADERSTMEDINNIYVPNSSGQMIPFSALADVEYDVGPRKINRFNQIVSAEVKAEALPGISSGLFMKKIESVPLPEGYHIEWTGISYQERKNEGRIVLLLTMAVVFGYLFLVAQYESWTVPVPVILSVAVATLGALIGILICGMSLSIYAQLGLVMLIGLASKNAILMVEFSKHEHEQGMTIQEAALSGASQRFRAVLMTAWSFILGVVPLVIASGAGAGSRVAIGVPTFSGMLLATLVGIAFVPALYAVCQRMRESVQPSLRRQYARLQEERRLRLEGENRSE